MKKIIVTGGLGFIGSNLIELLLVKKYYVINIDKITYSSNFYNTREFERNMNYQFIKSDINNKKLFNIFLKHKPSCIFNLAAETHVDRSIDSPGDFINSNINGVYNILECFKKYYEKYQKTKLIHISTDEVYGTLDLDLQEESFKETSHYRPNSPYSASKAGAELFVRSFQKTYGLNVLTTSCSNNYGERQNTEKLIPHVITQCLMNKTIAIHGEGKNIRDWLYVDDHCEAIMSVLASNASSGSKYCIGGDDERDNMQVVKAICDRMDIIHPMINNKSYHSLVTFVKDRPGNDLRYSVDIGKIKKDLHWSPRTSFEMGLDKVIKWYINNFKA